MGPDDEHHDADVLIGVITWQGSGRRADDKDRTARAEVIRFAPYLLARRGRALPPPA